MSYDPYHNQYIPPPIPTPGTFYPAPSYPVAGGYCPPPPATGYCPPPPVVVPASGHYHYDGQYHVVPPVVYPPQPTFPHHHQHHHHHHGFH